MATGTDRGNRFAGAGGTASYTPDDRSYVRRKRGRIHVDTGAEEEGELNIVPYLDIMMNLIIFMLVAKSASVSLGMIDVTAPTYAEAGVATQPPEDPDSEKKKLDRLTVGVARNGFYIAAVGGVLPGDTEPSEEELTQEGVALRPPSIPLKDGAHDFRSLARKMRGIKNAFPATEAIYLAADDDIPYEVVVRTLDATREDSDGKLFPAVAFSQITN